jgi:hypothetical protein
MNASSPMFCLVYEGNYEVIALRLLQRRLHLVALYWHPTISLSISFQLKRPTRPIEECSSLPTACICKLSFLIAFAFGNIFYRMQSLFAWCVSITRRTYILWLDLRAIARLLAFCSIDLWFSNMPMAISGARRAGQAGGSLPSYDQPQGLGRVCVCPHLRPEGEESRPYARLRVRSPTPLVGSGWVFALQDGLLNGIVRITGWSARAVSHPKQEPRKIRAAPIVQVTAQGAMLVHCYLQHRCCRRWLIRWIEHR